MSDKRCGILSAHGPHSWGDLNWCPGSVEAMTRSAENDAPVMWSMPRSEARDLLRWLRHNRPLGMPDQTLNGLADALIAAGRARVTSPARQCPTCVHAEGYDRLSGPCPTCHGTGVTPPAKT